MSSGIGVGAVRRGVAIGDSAENWAVCWKYSCAPSSCRGSRSWKAPISSKYGSAIGRTPSAPNSWFIQSADDSCSSGSMKVSQASGVCSGEGQPLSGPQELESEVLTPLIMYLSHMRFGNGETPRAGLGGSVFGVEHPTDPPQDDQCRPYCPWHC